jgi:hypothetical protein
MVIELTVPADCVKLNELAYPLPADVEISNPEGAVSEMFAVKSLPETVIVWADEAVPRHVLKALIEPVAEILGHPGMAVAIVTVGIINVG